MYHIVLQPYNLEYVFLIPWVHCHKHRWKFEIATYRHKTQSCFPYGFQRNQTIEIRISNVCFRGKSLGPQDYDIDLDVAISTLSTISWVPLQRNKCGLWTSYRRDGTCKEVVLCCMPHDRRTHDIPRGSLSVDTIPLSTQTLWTASQLEHRVDNAQGG